VLSVLPMPESTQLTRRLREAGAALRRRDFRRARNILDDLGAKHPDHPDRLHMLGLLHKSGGDAPGAERFLRASLVSNPDQPSVHSNLGNVLKQMQRYDEAEEAYRCALRLEPGHIDALKNHGLLLAAMDRDSEAVEWLEAAVKQNPRDAAVWTTLGQCYRRLGELERSLACFKKSLNVRPQHSNAIAGLGQTLRMLGRPEEAARYFDAALELTNDSVELMLSRADVAANQGQFEEAEARYREVLRLAPTHTGAHTQLSEMLWQLGRTEIYGESFQEALAEHPDNPELLGGWCEGLAATGAGDEALGQLQSRAGLVQQHPQLLHVLAKRQAASGQTDEALGSFRRAMSAMPEDPQLSLDYAQFAIFRGNYDEALAALEVTESARPDDQLMWACRGLCWRLSGDERAEWLNDEAQLIRTFEIDCPPAYGTLERFLVALAETLTAIHQTRGAPAHQSLRGGTQTAPSLFYRPDKVIQALRSALISAVQCYIDELPEDPQHPMLRRRSRRFHFAGSWSVRLRSGGYHVNHVHPQGWISSSHYVTVPAAIGASAAEPAGWLKFGESGLGLGDREVVSQLIKPEPGLVTLFPSYFWHGTVPFQSAEPRLTTPFAVAPAR